MRLTIFLTLLLTFFVINNIPPFLLISLSEGDLKGKWNLIECDSSSNTGYLILNNDGTAECNIVSRTYSKNEGINIKSYAKWKLKHYGFPISWERLKLEFPFSQRPVSSISFMAHYFRGRLVLTLSQPDNYQSIPFILSKEDADNDKYMIHFLLILSLLAFFVYYSWRLLLKPYLKKSIDWKAVNRKNMIGDISIFLTITISVVSLIVLLL